MELIEAHWTFLRFFAALTALQRHRLRRQKLNDLNHLNKRPQLNKETDFDRGRNLLNKVHISDLRLTH